MANEAIVRGGLRVEVGSLLYESAPSSFRADVSVANGPSPGAVRALTTPTEVPLSQFTAPGLAVIQNLDESNYVEVGLYDEDTGVFYPLLKVLPGEAYPIRLSPVLTP